MPAPATRRTLRFSTIDEALADVDGLAAAETAGTLVTTGRWTFGQALDHLATWVDFAYDGLPMAIPLPFRLIMRLAKPWILYKPMRPGSQIPRIPDGTLATAVVPSDVGLAHVRRAYARLRDDAPTRPHPALGFMTHGEWLNLHLRHAELHLSFFHPSAQLPAYV